MTENLFKRDDRTSCKKIPIGQTFLNIVQRALELLNFYLTTTEVRKKAGWIKICLRNKFLQWITTLGDRIGKPC